MADLATDYTHGQMDIREQASSFDGFIKMTKWGSLGVSVLVLFATLWFCTDAGFSGGLISAVVLLALGVFFLRDKPDAH